MKTFIHIALCCLLLSCQGCNSDLFIEDFRPSVSHLTLDGNGDKATVHFKSSHWNSVEVHPMYSESLHCQVYDADGNPAENATASYLNGRGKMVCKQGMGTFTLERNRLDELTITVDENAYSDSLRFTLVVSNDYETKDISVAISPCDRYIVRQMTYALDTFQYSQPFEEKRQITISNSSSDIVTILPFQDEKYLVAFICDNPETFRLIADTPDGVEVPCLNNGHLTLEGLRASYTSGWQRLPLSFPDAEKKQVTIPPHSQQRITTFVEYEWFETSFTLHAVHPTTGKERVLTGTLQGKRPNKYYITRENLNDQPHE